MENDDKMHDWDQQPRLHMNSPSDLDLKLKIGQWSAKLRRKLGNPDKSLKSHMLSFHTKPEDIPWFKCDHEHHDEMENDDKMRKEMFDCCNKIEKYTCQRCPNFATNFLVFITHHLREIHTGENSTKAAYKCTGCSFVTSSKHGLAEHKFCECQKRNEHDWDQQPRLHMNSPSDLDLKLKIGQWSAKLRRKLNNTDKVVDVDTSHQWPEHEQCAEDIQWLLCDHCSYKCKHEGSLKRHITLHHSKLEHFNYLKCDHCPSKLKKGSLKSHMLSFHTKPEDILWFKCDHCSYKTKRKRDLKVHVKVRHGAPMVQVLSLKSKQMENLGKVTFLHSKPGDFNGLKCDQCPSILKSEACLRSHIISFHTKPEDIQWFECDHCSYKSKLQIDVKTHVELRHGRPLVQRRSLKSKQMKNLKNVTFLDSMPEDSNWLKCDQCPSILKNKACLKSHIMSIHTKPEDIQWFKCDHCSYKSKRKINVNVHIKVHHGPSVNSVG